MNAPEIGIKFVLDKCEFKLFDLNHGIYYHVEFTRVKPGFKKYLARVYKSGVLIYEQERSTPVTRIKAVILVEDLISGRIKTGVYEKQA